MIKLEMVNEVKAGSKLLLVNTDYDAKGNIIRVIHRNLEVIRTSRKSITVKDKTYNFGFHISKDYKLGEIINKSRNEYYLTEEL